MPNPGIALGSAPAWLTRLRAPGWQAAEQTPARGSPARGAGGHRDAPRIPQKLSTTGDPDLHCTAWPTQPAQKGHSPKTGGMRAHAGAASASEGSQQGFRSGLGTHAALEMQKTPCDVSSCKQPPRETTGEVSVVGWAGAAEVIKGLVNELSLSIMLPRKDRRAG